ncbi:MAG: hypothetical protein B6I18_08895, partial [Bacteroidetes bacterium 4572_112]
MQGSDKDSFCYWLEFKKIGFGIGGGNASKFGVYRTEKNNEYLYVFGYGKSRQFLKKDEALPIYKDILNKIIIAIEYTKNGQIEKIKELDIPMWNMVIQKILSIYYPESFLTIGASDVLINCANELELDNIELIRENSIQISHECKSKLSNSLPFNKWSYEKIGTFIWDFFEGENRKKSSKPSKQYWLYSPGTEARKWNEFYIEGIMGLGWDEIGDLTQYKSRDDIKKALVDSYGGVGSKKNDVSANDDFINKINIGDIIIIKKGKTELLGYGIVDSDYYYSNDYNEYKKIRKIDWKLKGSWKIDYNLVTKTLTDITKYKAKDSNYNTFYEQLMEIMTDKNHNNFEKKLAKFDKKELEDYFKFLREIINNFDLKYGDKRLVY